MPFFNLNNVNSNNFYFFSSFVSLYICCK